jgi:hypothetical protein
MVPRFVEERIRRPAPSGSSVVPGSTPVIAFGDPTVARVATLGLNPSRLEFLSRSGVLLHADRRLETLRSLGVTSLQHATPDAVERVWDGCRGYFRRNPYRRWFDQLEAVLRRLGASYYAGSACHLHLVQWATDPTWAKLDRRTRLVLLAPDVSFLRRQLTAAPIHVLLINGSGVIGEFEPAFGCRLDIVDRLQVGRLTTTIHSGRLSAGTHLIAWSLNLQSSRGVMNEMRMRLAERVAVIVRGR